MSEWSDYIFECTAMAAETVGCTLIGKDDLMYILTTQISIGVL